MNLKWTAAVAALLAAASGAESKDYFMKPVGAWFVTGGDRFDDGGKYYAQTVQQGYVLAVRCIRRNLSIGIKLTEGVASEGELYGFDFRVDNLPTITAVGKAVSYDYIVIENVDPKLPQLIDQMRGHRELAMQIESRNGALDDRMFLIRGAEQAFADIIERCPLDKQPVPTSDADQ